MTSESAVNGLLALAAFSVLVGVLVAWRTLYRARGVPRTALQYVTLGGALFCIAVGVSLFYGGRQFQRQMRGTDALVGKSIPAFRYRLMPGGDEHSTAEWQGKAVLLNVWATWCEPCREELQTLSRMRQNTDVMVLAISDEDPGTVEAFLKTNRYDLSIGYVARGSGGPEPLTARIPVRPVTFVIDAKGLIREIRLGAMEPAAIEKLLSSYRN